MGTIKTGSLITTAAAALLLTSAASAADIVVNIEGLQEGGTLYVGVQTEDQFMQQGGVAGDIIKNVSEGDMTVTIEDVAPGTYSISVWHDREDDGEFSMAPQGWPNEGWAMVNGETLRAAPTFDQVSFELTDEGYEATLTVIYPPQ
jgi:uncharacterized protein (DUF2141 family)